jgi:hypothetical protein
MTGSDIADWIAGILDDLLDLGSADVPLLLFKLVVLFGVSFFAWQFGKLVLKAVRSVVEPVLRLLWRIVSAPVRLPFKAVKRLFRTVLRWRHARRRQQHELAEAERQREGERAAARERAEALATASKILDVD